MKRIAYRRIAERLAANIHQYDVLVWIIHAPAENARISYLEVLSAIFWFWQRVFHPNLETEHTEGFESVYYLGE